MIDSENPNPPADEAWDAAVADAIPDSGDPVLDAARREFYGRRARLVQAEGIIREIAGYSADDVLCEVGICDDQTCFFCGEEQTRVEGYDGKLDVPDTARKAHYEVIHKPECVWRRSVEAAKEWDTK